MEKNIEVKGKDLEIINGLRNGKRIKQIAYELNLSEEAASNRIRYLKVRLNINTTIQLVSAITEIIVANQLKNRY